MKRLILIKESLAIQTAHLYEHIFCMSIDELFRQNNLYPQLDYSLSGMTFHGGIIMIDIELYTADAFNIAKQIAHTKVHLNEAAVLTAGKQLLAEIGEHFGSTGYDNISKAITQLDKQPWKTIDEVDSIDVKHLRRTQGPFYKTDDGRLPIRKLSTTIILENEFAKSHRQLLPLFRQLSRLINASLQATVSNTHGYFSYEDIFMSTSSKTEFSNIFCVAALKDETTDVHAVMQTCIQTVNDMKQGNVFSRYLHELRTLSYYEQPMLAPNIELNYQETLLLVGSAGWKQLATDQNTKDLLNNMQIRVTYGRQRTATTIGA